jgi:hypothetical protein
MDSTSSISTINPSLNTNSILTSNTNTGTSNFFTNISGTTWVIIFIVLALLGFNIFIYIAKGTQTVSEFISPFIAGIASLFGNTLANSGKQIVDTAATGTTAVTNTVANTLDGTIDAINVQGATASTSLLNSENNDSVPVKNQMEQNSLNNALNNEANYDQPYSYNADESSSTIQSNKSSKKSGFCYIGEDRGYRSCINVGESDTCMSGDIFPSQEICVNPSLRP